MIKKQSPFIVKDQCEEFRTRIDNVDFVFQAYYDFNSNEFAAEAYLYYKGYYCNSFNSKKSIEDAILNLVKIIENGK